MRPRVGITLAFDSTNEGRFSLRQDYVRSVEQAGGLPLVLAPGRPSDAKELLDQVHALILTGGSDVDPALYGEERHETVKQVFPERDDFEIALCREAARRDLPLLAICRGHQVLNVATGGTLVQDIPSEIEGACPHDPDVARWETAHEVRILPGTRLREILRSDKLAVNSFHHQAVKELGEGLVVSARSEDGVVEGIEAPRRSLCLGVQWHPESFWNHEARFRPLFEALVEMGGARR